MAKDIEDMIRVRFLLALDEQFKVVGQYKKIMESLDEVQQVHVQIKSGRRRPTLKHIVLLNQVYGYSFKWIMTGRGPKFDKPPKDIHDEVVDLAQQMKQIIARLPKKR